MRKNSLPLALMTALASSAGFAHGLFEVRPHRMPHPEVERHREDVAPKSAPGGRKPKTAADREVLEAAAWRREMRGAKRARNHFRCLFRREGWRGLPVLSRVEAQNYTELTALLFAGPELPI